MSKKQNKHKGRDRLRGVAAARSTDADHAKTQVDQRRIDWSSEGNQVPDYVLGYLPPLDERGDRGQQLPSVSCPYCKIAGRDETIRRQNNEILDLQHRLVLLDKHLDQHGFPREGPMRSIANGDPIPEDSV